MILDHWNYTYLTIWNFINWHIWENYMHVCTHAHSLCQTVWNSTSCVVHCSMYPSLFLFSIVFSFLIFLFFSDAKLFVLLSHSLFLWFEIFLFSSPHESKKINTRNRARTWWLILFPCVWSNSCGLKWLVSFNSGAC